MREIEPADLIDETTALTTSGTGAAEPLLVDLDRLLVGEVAGLLDRLPPSLPLVIGVSEHVLGPAFAPLLERLTLTLAPGGPGRSWIDTGPGTGTPTGPAEALAAIERTARTSPAACQVLAGLLVHSEGADVRTGLALESLAYSTLLASGEFSRWSAARRAERPHTHSEQGGTGSAPPAVLLARDGSTLSLRLNRPERHNAFSSRMRDALLEALSVAAADREISSVDLAGLGRSFCSGGDLDEFGTFGDPALAHLVRTEHNLALALHGLRDRVVPTVHGACVGAGIEIPSFATRVRAREDSWFQLPELGMGLIPGAGGTVSIPRRIGRWRTAFLALSGQPLGLEDALQWGLVDELA